MDIKSIINRKRRQESIPGITERFTMDVNDYLESKFPGLLEHEVMEAATYIGQRFIITVNDVIMARDKEWDKRYNEIVDELKEVKHERRKHENS